MREIKFRAWDNKKKQMRLSVMIMNSFVFEEKDPPGMDKQSVIDVCNPDGTKDTYYKSWPMLKRNSNLITMQYTGLKDQNGKEIYEGDLIRFYYSFDPFEIIFDEGCFCYELTGGQMIPLGKNHNFCKDSHLFIGEIVGNIYEGQIK